MARNCLVINHGMNWLLQGRSIFLLLIFFTTQHMSCSTLIEIPEKPKRVWAIECVQKITKNAVML